MAPNSKHRKDPTDPHLKFLTRSRQLITGARESMIYIERISAEIHQLSQNILSESVNTIQPQSSRHVGEEDIIQDPHIEREISFDVPSFKQSVPAKPVEPDKRKENRVGSRKRSDHLEVYYPLLRPASGRRSRGYQDETMSKRQKMRQKLPVVPKTPAREQKVIRSAYRVNQIPYVPQKTSTPRIHQEPIPSYKGNTAEKEIYRINLHKVQLGGTDIKRLPSIDKTNERRQGKSGFTRKSDMRSTDESLPMIRRQLPVYRTPTVIMQPPGYAPRVEQKISQSESKTNEQPEKKVDGSLPILRRQLTVYKAPSMIMQPPGSARRVEQRFSQAEFEDVEKPHSPRKKTEERLTEEQLPELKSRVSRASGKLRRGTLAISRSQMKSATLSHRLSNINIDLSVNGRTLNEDDASTDKSYNSRIGPRCKSNTVDQRRLLKRKNTVVLPKVNPGPLVSPDFKPQKSFHRPSYLITSPVPVTQLNKTESMESFMALSPLPFAHSITLTPRQTALLSGSPLPGNFLTTSRPGSVIRDSPLLDRIARLPNLVNSGRVSASIDA